MEIQWLDEIDSTNSLLRRSVEAREVAPPCVVAAKKQTGGRGRGGNSWWSPPGCLMFSMLLDSRRFVESQALIPQASLAVGLAAAECVQQWTGLDAVQVKWPNDLYLYDRKLAGILIESIPVFEPAVSSINDRSLWWIVGMGINISVDWSGAPVDVRERGICLATAGCSSNQGAGWTPESFLPLLADRIVSGLSDWGSNPRGMIDRYRQRCFLTGKTIQVETAGKVVTGVCEGISNSGNLQLRTLEGVISVDGGTVRF